MNIDPTSQVLRDVLRPVEPNEQETLDRVRLRLDGIMVDAPRPAQMRVSARRRPAFVGIAATAAALVAVGGAAAATGVIEIPFFAHDAAKQVQALSDPSVEGSPASPAERDMLRQIVRDITNAPRDPSLDYGPTLAELPALSTARVLVDDDRHGRVAAIASTRGDVCAVYSVQGEFTNATCFVEFEAQYGITLAESANTATGTQLFGLAKSDVDEIDVIDQNGTRSAATLNNNAWVWRSDSVDQKSVSLLITRSGSQPIKRAVQARAVFE